MAGFIFDTSVYVAAIRLGDLAPFSARRRAGNEERKNAPVWLNAVVLEELYAGANDRTAQKLCARLERDFENARRLLTPNKTDWVNCGQTLARIGAKYGYEQIGRARLTNDALIAMSAARNGFTVLTKNAADFRLIAEFRPFQWEEI
jgi:predicted nucleic acid-binding protein